MEWLSALKILIADIDRFSRKPYRWLLYLAYCAVGTRGRLSSSENDDEDIDFDADEIQYRTVYYHLPEDAYANLFPLDPDLRSIQTEASGFKRSKMTCCVETGTA